MAQQEEHKGTTVDTQINELDELFQDLDINYMNTRSNSQNSRNSDRSFNSSFSRSTKSNFQSSPGSYRSNYRQNNYQRYNINFNNNSSNCNQFTRNNYNRYDNNQNRFNNRKPINKYKHYSNQPRAQIVFEYTQNNPMEMLDTLRNFINHMKRNPTSSPLMKVNKIAPRNTSDVNESNIHTGSLEQVQK